MEIYYYFVFLRGAARCFNQPHRRKFCIIWSRAELDLGLPSWLLGCALAELFCSTRGLRVSTGIVWVIRLGIIISAAICSVLRFHSAYGYPWTLNFFALLVPIWLYYELKRWQYISPPHILEWAGSWSYSLYLIHYPASTLFAKLQSPVVSSSLNWCYLVIFVLLLSYIFYLLVELPSHSLARIIAKAIR